jgi:glycosyltransferase involved in cell wall biosynthesis
MTATAVREITYGLDATPLLGRRTGIGRYVAEVADGVLAGLAQDERLLLYAGTFRLNPLMGVSHEPLYRLARDPRVRYRRHWFPVSAAHAVWNRVDAPPLEALTGPLDVFHGTNFRLPPLGQGRGVVTIHDLAFLADPGFVPPLVGTRLARAVRAAARRAERVIVGSRHTAEDAVRFLGCAPGRVAVIPFAASPAFRPSADRDADRRAVAERHGVTAPYVLHVGTTNPRKNLVRLVRAFADTRRHADLPHVLVLAGEAGFAHAEVRAEIARLGVSGAVVLTDYAREEDMPSLYRASDLLAFPSLYEGFGIPVVEAMACGCPVLTSDVSALPEVAGDAALLVDPRSEDAIAAGILRLIEDRPLRERLVAAGFSRAAEFSWARGAAAHLALYRELAAPRVSAADRGVR